MIALALVLLAAVALAPLLWSFRADAPTRGRRDAAMALHRAQLAELDRDLADGRISVADHATAQLEVQRRLLAAAAAADPEPARAGGQGVVIGSMIAVPVIAAGLYLVNGRPGLPAAPLAERLAQAEAAAKDQDGLLRQLRDKISGLPPQSEQARQGYVLLGNMEDSRGNLAEAAKAWKTAVTIRFDPTLAAEAAEAQTQLDGRVTPATAGLFREALAQAPADAPWRQLVEKRLAER